MHTVPRYDWKQEYDEITISFNNPEATAGSIKCITKGRDIKIQSGGEAVLEGKLLHPVVPLSVGWVLDDGVFCWYAQKYDNLWWDTLLEGEDGLDNKETDESTNCVSSGTKMNCGGCMPDCNFVSTDKTNSCDFVLTEEKKDELIKSFKKDKFVLNKL